MSEIYGYSSAVSRGNTPDETLMGIRRQIDAQNSLARDNFSSLRTADKQNKIVAQQNIEENKVISIEEKPVKPKSNKAIIGVYIYDNTLIDKIQTLEPSDRGEYEITDVNKEYLRQKKLEVKILGRGSVWLDTGTFPSLMQANQYVQVIEERQGRKIGCIEEAAYRMGFINKDQLMSIAEPLRKSGYGEYLINLV